MKELIRQLLRRGAQKPSDTDGSPHGKAGNEQKTALQPMPAETADRQETKQGETDSSPRSDEEREPAPKLPPELPLFFMLSHLDDDGPVRLDGVKLGVCEVMGLEIDEPKLGAFAGALNALDFPAQLLIRQHPPRLERMREKLLQAQPEDLPPQTRAAAESLGRLLTDLEARDGILDRRFYAVCEFGRIDDLRGLLARAGLSVHSLRGRQLRMMLVAAALGGSPSEFDEESPIEVEIGRRTCASETASCAPSTWASGPAPWPQASCKDSWPRARRWTCPSTSAQYRLSRRRGRWSGRRCASSRPRASPSSGAAPCPPRRRSPWRTSPG